MALNDITTQNIVYSYVRSLPPKVIDHISPSMLGGCMRVHWLAIKHQAATTPPNPGALVNFQLGFLFEDLVTKAFNASDLKVTDQQSVEDKELNVAGTLDYMLEDPETGEIEVIDTKTESILASGYRRREKKTFLQAHPEYEMQLGTYMLLLKRQGKDVKRGRFLVITKDNGQMSEHYVVLTEELEQRMLSRIRQLNGYLERDEMPPCECEGWKVGYCNYGDPNTQIKNTTGKVVNVICCPDSIEVLNKWRKDNE